MPTKRVVAKPAYNAPALRMGVKLIEILAGARESMGLSELARALSSNKNMTYRLLTTLLQEGWVASEGEPARYHLTLRPFRITSEPLTRMSLKQVSLEPMHRLWKKLGESTYLGILAEKEVLYIEHLDGFGPFRIAAQVGGSYPLHVSAPGKVLLAHGGGDLFEKVLQDKPKRYTENTLTGRRDLEAELERIREQGYAIDNEEYARGLLCLSAPIFDAQGAAAGAIGCAVPLFHYSTDRLLGEVEPLVTATAREISRRLGHLPIQPTNPES